MSLGESEVHALAAAMGLRLAVVETLLSLVLSRACGGSVAQLNELHRIFVEQVGQMPMTTQLSEAATVAAQDQLDGIFLQARKFAAAVRG